MAKIRWSATLSNGQEITEHEGDYQVIENESLPWRRLCEFSQSEGLNLTSLSLRIDEREVHLPLAFNRFNLGKFSLEPQSYAVQFSMEVNNIMGGMQQSEYVDLIAEYADFNLHYIHSLADKDSWIVITKGDEPMISSPRKS